MNRSQRAFWVSLTLGGAYLVLIVIVNSILDIGGQLNKIHPVAAIIFYSLCGLAFLVAIVRPLWIVLSAPAIDRSIFHHSHWEELDYRKVIRPQLKRLLRYASLTAEEKDRLKLALIEGSSVSNLVAPIMGRQVQKVNDCIKEAAIFTLFSTAISQNGRLDAAMVLVNNFRMIKNIVGIFGYRPSSLQLWRLYATILLTSLVSMELDDIDIVELIPQLNQLNVIPGFPLLASSLLQGTGSAFLTLRVGYLTRKFLTTPQEEYNRRQARKEASREAAKSIIPVCQEACKRVPEVARSFGDKLA
jgi:hypothetical protein